MIFNFTNYLNKIALISENKEVTYLDIEENVSKVKNIIEERCLVFLVCTNTIDSIISYVSIIKSGSVCMLISDINISSLIEKYNPRYIFTPKEKNSEYGVNKCEIGEYVLIQTSFSNTYQINKDLAILLTTSGSTGTPKFVRISYANLVDNTNSIIEYLNIDDTHRAITTMPMSYTYGLSIINTHLNSGASIVVTEHSLMNREFWNLIKEKEVTNFGGVPYTYEMLKKLRFERQNILSLKYVTQAGGKLKKDLVEEFYKICSRKNVDFIVMYGQTEATSRMSYLPTKYLPEKAGSIGIAIPNGKFSIINELGEEIKENFKSGELIYSGKNVSMGYAQSYEDLNLEDINNGILHTGDIAQFDEDGFFYIVGRKKRFVKIYGNRVNLDEIEHMLKKYGYECACIGEDDKLTLFIVDKIDTKKLLRRISHDTFLNKNVFELIQIDSIPRNESGKIQYSKLEKE